MAILETRDLRKSFGALAVTDGVSFALEGGETHALIGPNGAGKTTLLNLLSGDLMASGGAVLLEGADISRLGSAARARRGVARTFQISTLLPSFTAERALALALAAREGHGFRLRRLGRRRDLRDRARALLDLVGLGGRGDTVSAALAHGEQRQLELALALASEPRILLLDEPMAGLGAEETGRMIELLRSLGGKYSIVLVEHDMDAVFALADRIAVLAEGRIIATGTADRIRADPRVRAAYFGDEHG